MISNAVDDDNSLGQMSYLILLASNNKVCHASERKTQLNDLTLSYVVWYTPNVHHPARLCSLKPRLKQQITNNVKVRGNQTLISKNYKFRTTCKILTRWVISVQEIFSDPSWNETFNFNH